MRWENVLFSTLLVIGVGCGSDLRQREDAASDLASIVDSGVDTASPICSARLPDAGDWPDPCGVFEPEQEDAVDEALRAVGFDRCTAVFSAEDKAVMPPEIWGDVFRLPFFDAVHGVAFRAPTFTRRLVQALDDYAALAPVSARLAVAARQAGHELRVCLPPLTPDKDHPLATAISTLFEQAGAPAELDMLRESTAPLPFAFRRALAPVVVALGRAARARAAALEGADLGQRDGAPGVDLQTLFSYAASLSLATADGKAMAPAQSWVQRLLAGAEGGFRYGEVYGAAIELALALEQAQLARFAGVEASLQLETPLGAIIIGGPGDDHYEPSAAEPERAIALLVDTGGDDSYRVAAGANISADNPVSVLVDLAGKDTYGYVAVPSHLDGERLPSDEDGRLEGTDPQRGNGPISLSMSARQGAGRLGIGMLWDLGLESDDYTSLRMSQGFGTLGVGVLYDAGGDDAYACEAGCQGAGIFGIGLLVDAGGNDTYRTYHQAQGYAFSMGVGVLYDGAGNDAYLADVGDPLLGGDPLYFTSQQRGRGNASFTQGAGFGRRADFSDFVFMSGGLGVLRDRAGDDVYEASVFAQGTGYWFGSGILADGEGDDRYDGRWYVQGATAHFALSVFWDGAGHDLYNSVFDPVSTSLGIGHDYSVSFFIDEAGDDNYRAPRIALGTGNDNGMGFFVDVAGRDRYEAVGDRTFGAAAIEAVSVGGPRAQALTLGCFVDAGGVDAYVIDGEVSEREGSLWRYESAHDEATRELGAGIDAQGGASLP